jgi:hypothetical protein
MRRRRDAFKSRLQPCHGLYELTAANASLAIGIVANGAAYQKGIMFGENALAGCDGTTSGGYAPAFITAQHQDYETWRDNGGIGVVAARIRSHVTTQSAEINFVNDALEVRDITDAATWLRIEGAASTVNHVRIIPAAAGGYPAFTPGGPDANIGFVINPKGAPAQTVYVSGRVLVTTEMQVGAAGVASGKLRLDGLTSGVVLVTVKNIAGTWTLTLLDNDGAANQLLKTDGNGVTEWVTLAASNLSNGVTGSGKVVLESAPTILGGFTVKTADNAKAMFVATSTGSPVNYIESSAKPTGSAPQFNAQGDDATVGLNFNSKNNGDVTFGSGAVWALQVTPVATMVNRLRVLAAATGNPALLQAVGSDTNVDLQLTPQGSGLVRFGAHSVLGAETMTGYITVKDAGGSSRKLAVVS